MRTAGAQDSMGTDPFLCISAGIIIPTSDLCIVIAAALDFIVVKIRV